MNNLVCLKEIRKEKTYDNSNIGRQRAQNRYKSRLKERINKSKTIIQNELNRYNNEVKEKISNNEVKDNVINLRSKDNKSIINVDIEKNCEMKINHILKNLFMLDNSRPLIDFLNSIFDDSLSLNTKINYINNDEKTKDNENFSLENTISDVKFLANDKNRIFKYKVKFQTKSDNQISINIFKYDLDLDDGQRLEHNYEKYKNHIGYKHRTEMVLPKLCIILIDSKVEVPDTYKVKLEFNNQSIYYKSNVLKSWKYDLKRLYQKNIYLLLPLKVFDLRKRLLSTKDQIELLSKEINKTLQQNTKFKNLIKDDIFNFFKSTNIYLNKIEQDGLIDNEDIKELNLISMDLLSYFINELGTIGLDVKEDVEYKLKKLYLG